MEDGCVPSLIDFVAYIYSFDRYLYIFQETNLSYISSNISCRSTIIYIRVINKQASFSHSSHKYLLYFPPNVEYLKTFVRPESRGNNVSTILYQYYISHVLSFEVDTRATETW